MNDSEEPIRVLLLEDDAVDAEFLSRQLKCSRKAFSVRCAPTLAEAVELLEQETFDVVLSDLTVPDSNGPDTIAGLRGSNNRVPIIAMTGMDSELVEQEILSSGGQDYLQKGHANGAEVVRAIEHAIQRQQSKNQIQALVAELSENQELLREQAKKLARKNRRLRKLYKMAHEFVDNVSHDFRTPLTVIKDYVSLVREGIVGEVNDEQRSMLEKVGVRADDLNHMVDDLLDVSKLDSGMLCCWRRTATPEAILQHGYSMLQERAEVAGIELVLDCPDDLPEIYCDIEKAGRVLMNLAVNAIKFTERGGLVRLWATADAPQGQVTLGVTDNGPGIEASVVEKIFERFEQTGVKMEPTTKGVGLGLSIAQRLTRLNLGELSVKSRPGKGSTFAFTLPLAAPVEVFRRWSKIRTKRPVSTQLIQITIDPHADEARGQDCDEFLSSSLRRDDLLFRVGDTRWLLVLTAEQSDLDEWSARLLKEQERANRNRPMSQLPPLEVVVMNSWGDQQDSAERLRDFESACREGATTSNQGASRELAGACADH